MIFNEREQKFKSIFSPEQFRSLFLSPLFFLFLFFSSFFFSFSFFFFSFFTIEPVVSSSICYDWSTRRRVFILSIFRVADSNEFH